jgi:hypothetical protein
MALVRSMLGENLSCFDKSSWIGEKLPEDGDSVVIASGSHFIDTFPPPPANREMRRAMVKQKQVVPPRIVNFTVEIGASYGFIKQKKEENDD